NFTKALFEFTSWSNQIKLPVPILNVKSIKMRWMFYETASTGGRMLKMGFKHLGSNGVHYLNNGETDDYFYSTSLDSRANVALYNENFTGEHDVYFASRIPKLTNFEIEFTINNAPALDITNLNPLIVEFGFYH
ncbi:MAG: hypothetical protein Q8J97_06380, partial [Flavobacteriaceae bacterium]|nr:hypothetical protein [Flavobacteriaceae bacterium]